MLHLELAAFSLTSALLALDTGVSRIELCADPAVGGTTPDFSTFRELQEQVKDAVPINIMLRPRGGGFLYNSSEVEVMGKTSFLISFTHTQKIRTGYKT